MSVHQTVPVIFRRWPNGDICALFPTIASDYEGRHCTVYSHIGQHGAAEYGHVIDQTKPATPDEYAPLMRELESIGYENLRVYRRANWRFHAARRCVGECRRHADAGVHVDLNA